MKPLLLSRGGWNRRENTVKKKLLIALVIVILLVVYYLLSMDYLKQRQQQAALASQISDVTLLLAQMPEPPWDLEQRLASAQDNLTAEQKAFPGEVNSTRVINAILELADECQVKAMPLITEPRSAAKIGEHDYYIFRLNVAVEGSYSNLASFTGRLESEEFETLIVAHLSVTRMAGTSGEGLVPEGNIPVSASLDLSVYTSPPAAD
jgi:hypothetical protein